jgi:hypothetical protein
VKKIALLPFSLVLAAGLAHATGPGGSSEGAPKTKTYNNVRCGRGTNAGGFVVHASSAGVEACNSGAAKVPVQGRVMVANQQGGYVAADGDRDNRQNAYLQGYVRIDRAGAHCGKQKNVEDSTSAKQPKTNKCP